MDNVQEHGKRGDSPESSATLEAKLDLLTKLLVKCLKNKEVFFGICCCCSKEIIGDDSSGVSCMNQVFHSACFTCYTCQGPLQGTTFYSVDGSHYCELHYLDHLEKCCVCSEPVTDRILHIYEEPYHPKCFTCTVCFKCLDGIGCLRDKENKNYCYEDYHRKYPPCCSVCSKPIFSEHGKAEMIQVDASGRSCHLNCYNQE